MIRGPPTANDFLGKEEGNWKERQETVFLDDKLPFVSGAIDFCLLIRLLFEEISNYYNPYDCACVCVYSMCVFVVCFLTDSCDNTTLQISQSFDVSLQC